MKKFSYLELLRLFTSLAVVIFHYHFFFQETIVEGSSFPFFSILELVYNYGRYGVDMFWAISGFVFAHVYLDQIKKTSSILKGKNFLLTGKLEKMSRAEAKVLIEQNSGNVVSSYTFYSTIA